MFTIGADPELFFRNNYKLVSVIDKLGGSKDMPLPLDVAGCAIQEDNVAAEYNIPPCKNVQEFIHYNLHVLNDLSERAAKLGLMLAPGIASHSFDDEELQHWKAGVFGCDPDYNAWTMEKNPPPYSPDPNLRSAGGHVHIGSDLDPWHLGRAADIFLGVPATLRDGDERRRSLYGKAGAVRIKPYGVEYRTLSNFWIWSEKDMHWVYEQTAKVIDFVENNQTIPEEMQYLCEQAINFGNKDACARVLEFTNGY